MLSCIVISCLISLALLAQQTFLVDFTAANALLPEHLGRAVEDHASPKPSLAEMASKRRDAVTVREYVNQLWFATHQRCPCGGVVHM